MADPIKIEVVYEVNDGEELGLYAEGHHEPAAFAAAVAEWRKGDGRWLDEGYIPEVPVDEVRHETWRNEEGGEGYVFRPALPGEPGAYPVTCFAFEGGMLAASPPPAPSPPETPRFLERCEHFGTEHAEDGGQCVHPALHDGPHRFEGAAPAPETPATEESEEKRERYIDAVERVVKALAAGERPKCRTCERPAVCVGAYEESENLDFACDECCGHGNEDGWCVPLASPASAPRETPVESEPKTCERCGYVGGGGWLPGWDTDPTAGTQPRGMKCPDCASPPPESPASAPSRGTDPATKEQS